MHLVYTYIKNKEVMSMKVRCGIRCKRLPLSNLKQQRFVHMLRITSFVIEKQADNLSNSPLFIK